MRKTAAILLGSLLAAGYGAATAQERGLAAASDALGGPMWQVRFERGAGTAMLADGSGSILSASGMPVALNLLGDYQFSTLRLGQTGGLRLTSGLLINLRPLAPGWQFTDSGSARPYAGVGYASGGLQGEWGFSADLGLAASGVGSPRLGRLLGGGGMGVDSPLRLLPVVRLGMSLSF
jgi:hypothetical protein